MYESIVKGEYRLEPGIPESFKVLMQELRALALNVTLLNKTDMLAKMNKIKK
jgi:DNA-directed RNA polymerase subunit beta